MGLGVGIFSVVMSTVHMRFVYDYIYITLYILLRIVDITQSILPFICFGFPFQFIYVTFV